MKRDEVEIKKELEALDKLTRYPEFQVFIDVVNRMRVNLVSEIMREEITEEREEYLLGNDGIYRSLVDLKLLVTDRLYRMQQKGKVSALKTIVLYMREVKDRLFALIKEKDKERIKEEIINNNSLET